MRRRHFSKVAAIGLAAIAGCADGTQTVDGGDGQGNSPTVTATDASGDGSTGTPTATSSPTPGSASISIASHELSKVDTSYSTEAYVFADVVNDGKSTSGEISLTARFYDRDDNLLGNSSAYLVRLKPGETWKAAIWYLGDGKEVESHEIEGEFVEQSPNFSPDGVELTSSELSKTSDEATITGTIQNKTGDIVNYIEAHGLFYGDETAILGADWVNQSDIPDGDSWKFETAMSNQLGRVEKVNKHDVAFTISTY